MPFCPFFSTQCPETYEGDGGCAIWTHFGCCVIEKPGTPAVYTGGAEPVDVFILHFERRLPAPAQQFDVIYANAETGEISIDDDLSKFVIWIVHHPNSRG